MCVGKGKRNKNIFSKLHSLTLVFDPFSHFEYSLKKKLKSVPKCAPHTTRSSSSVLHSLNSVFPLNTVDNTLPCFFHVRQFLSREPSSNKVQSLHYRRTITKIPFFSVPFFIKSPHLFFPQPKKYPQYKPTKSYGERYHHFSSFSYVHTVPSHYEHNRFIREMRKMSDPKSGYDFFLPYLLTGFSSFGTLVYKLLFALSPISFFSRFLCLLQCTCLCIIKMKKRWELWERKKHEHSYK